MQLHCPFCGWRQVEEFRCRGVVAEFDPDTVSGVYQRVNRTDSSVEYWQHVKACRSWLQVWRNPTTGAVLEIRSLDSVARAGDSE
jgi:heterotetrameric sarcosine oxidase delta subunit